MSTKVEPADMSHETRIQSAKDKWANPGLAKRVVRMTAIFGGEHQKSGIDLLVEDHAHHENIPKYMIHPNNSIRRYVHIILVVLLSQDFDNPLTYFFLFSLSLSLSLSLFPFKHLFPPSFFLLLSLSLDSQPIRNYTHPQQSVGRRHHSFCLILVLENSILSWF